MNCASVTFPPRAPDLAACMSISSTRLAFSGFTIAVCAEQEQPRASARTRNQINMASPCFSTHFGEWTTDTTPAHKATYFIQKVGALEMPGMAYALAMTRFQFTDAIDAVT